MTTATATLTDFLLARIAEDEAEVARWRAAMEADEVAARGVPSWVIMAGGLKIPARVLAECEAKRRIVAEHQRIDYTGLYSSDTPATCRPCQDVDGYGGDMIGDRGTWPCPTLRALAAIHADHPDYRPEWRP